MGPLPHEFAEAPTERLVRKGVAGDRLGNTVDGLFCGVDTDGCVVGSTNTHLVATFGVRDLIIVHTPTATLVADQRDETAMRRLIAELERRGLTEFL